MVREELMCQREPKDGEMTQWDNIYQNEITIEIQTARPTEAFGNV